MSFIRSSPVSGARAGAHYLSSLSSAKLAAFSECAQDKATLLATVLIQNALRTTTYDAYVERSTSLIEYSHVEYSSPSSLGMLTEEDEETEVEVEEVSFDDDAFDFAPTLVSPISIPKTTATVEPVTDSSFSFLESHFSSEAQREHQWFEECMADLEADHDDFFTASPSPPSSRLDSYSSELVSPPRPSRSSSIDSLPSLHDDDCESCGGSDDEDGDSLASSVASLSPVSPVEIKRPKAEALYFERREELPKEQWRIAGKPTVIGGLALTRPKVVVPYL